jgi:transketolase
MTQDLARTTIDTLRTLAMDAVQQAESGHPGTPMALAPVAYALWHDVLRYDPEDPLWPGRDRFVLSCGHASMLLYGMIHLAGVRKADARGRPTREEALTLDELKAFRQLGSPTPGHPELGHTTGVETTTGPLGQGVSNAAGMALARAWLAARYGEELFGWRVFALCSDGDMMEGVASEAASLAGHLRLPNLCWIWDDNRITIDGSTELAFTEDVCARFRAYGWRVHEVPDANDVGALVKVLRAFEADHSQPTFVRVRSHIGWGAPNKQDTASAHGEPLGEEEVKRAKKAYGWPEDARFRVPEGVREHLGGSLRARGGEARRAWVARFDALRRKNPARARELETLLAGALPAGWEHELPSFPADQKGMASRAASGKVLNALAKRVPWVVGGSADLAPSNKTMLEFDGAGTFSAHGRAGRNLHFGVREHAMASLANGMALAGLRPYVGTFLIFSDYMRPAQRLAALMGLPVIHVFTHDSIGVGEDGPTHQPIEQLAALRAIPNLVEIRPCDANETAVAWQVALSTRSGPVALVLTRQNLPTLDRARFAPADGLARGGYVLAEAEDGAAQVLLIASGSEVSLCVEARERLAQEGIGARVVSLPSFALFARQDASYREAVLPPDVPARVAVEAAAPFGWHRWVGERGAVIGMEGFGASAPAKELYRHFGLTVERVVDAARRQLSPART